VYIQISRTHVPELRSIRYVWFCGERLDPARRRAGRTPDLNIRPRPKEPTMVRRYEEPIEVRAGAGLVPDPSPSAFLWRGRLYIVREVIGHWRERRAWWREALDPDEDTAAQVTDCLDQDVWRVEASPGRLAGTGVYDLGKDGDPGKDGDLGRDGPARGWRLLRVAD
jgi:Family of unknown function (DUF6504)